MRQFLFGAILVAVLGFSFGIGAGTTPQENRNASSERHRAAVKMCRDNYDAAVRAAKDLTTQQAQQQAVAAAKRTYDDCMKSASRIH
jgi:gas vesicle protein